jgi:hypothetical protein
MLGFGHTHKWKPYGPKYHGARQSKCSRCGRIKNQKARQNRRCIHRWKLDRRRKDQTLVCRKCGAARVIESHPRGWEPEPEPESADT